MLQKSIGHPKLKEEFHRLESYIEEISSIATDFFTQPIHRTPKSMMELS